MFKHIEESLLPYEDLETTQGNGLRLYQCPNGIQLPSITTVLGVLSKDSIAAWRAKVGDEEADKISYRASTRGTLVHEICEKYVNNDPNYRDGYMPNIVNDFNKLKEILDERLSVVYCQEAPLYSLHLGVAGRVDCVGIFDGKLSIIDYKTSRKPKRKEWITGYFMQETAYSIMWEERTGIPITQLVTIISVDGYGPQVFIEHRDNWVPKLKETIEEFKRCQVSALDV